MAIEWILLIYTIGVALVAVEPFLPTGGVLGVIGAIMATVGVIAGFRESPWLGMGQVLVGVVLALVTTKIFVKKVAHQDSQPAELAPEAEVAALSGRLGVAVSPLRPSGNAEFGGKRFSVVTRGEMIDMGDEVVCLEVQGNRIVVGRPKKPA